MSAANNNNVRRGSNKKTTIRIVFDNPRKAYFAGKHITGKVHMDIPRTTSTRGVYVVMLGGCVLCLNRDQRRSYQYRQILYHPVQFEGQHVPRGHTTSSYETCDIYFDARQKVFGSQESDDAEVVLPAGHHVFNFAFILPPKLPTSYEGMFGFVRYTCTAVIRGVGKNYNLKYADTFTVISIVDLNLMPNIELAQLKEEKRHLGFLFFKTGPIRVKLVLNKKGFVPGENILISGEIINDSNRDVLKTVISLCSLATFEDKYEFRQCENKLAKLEKGPIPPQVTQRWTKVHFKIPATAPSKLGGCRFINLEYCLLFCIVPSGPSANIYIRFPIVIGTVPLVDQFNTFRPFGVTRLPEPDSSPNSPTPSTGDLMTFTPETPPPYTSPLYDMYPDMPPPSYEECIHNGADVPSDSHPSEAEANNEVDSEDEDDEAGDSGPGTFAPRYSYYNQFGTVAGDLPTLRNENEPGSTLACPKNNAVIASVENLSIT